LRFSLRVVYIKELKKRCTSMMYTAVCFAMTLFNFNLNKCQWTIFRFLLIFNDFKSFLPLIVLIDGLLKVSIVRICNCIDSKQVAVCLSNLD
jgi:hypothetical protein